MTSDQSDLGPMPEPVIEPGEPNPGGPDAKPDDANGTIPDPPVSDNPSIAQQVPEPLKQEVESGEDTSTKATRSADGEDDEPEKESPA
ncbi:hypothetical protein KM427_06355 [Nocardioides sp. LMS-CY]|uniref:Uncharacterized protein n=1 Tax=Nocardioides soli TaxID=1036020 RepID=A0A7W4Z1F3_9ACTN|nr:MULTISPECIES: hypothetical protein [Nocardioides]MBB3041480.1 hypothetical protein [Nocardioides soli]QWF23341.1 hypothetical protein KM427_06355 [Nocardioides sp. LMS-CY]